MKLIGTFKNDTVPQYLVLNESFFGLSKSIQISIRRDLFKKTKIVTNKNNFLTVSVSITAERNAFLVISSIYCLTMYCT